MKLFKRAATFCMAAAMALSLSVTAFAAKGDVVPTGTLTVTGDQLMNKDVTAIRMFTARVTQGSDTANASYVFDSYELEDAWLDFFKTTIGKETMGAVEGIDFSDSPTDDEYRDAAIKYVASLTNDSQDKGTLADFAEKAQDWARSRSNFETYFSGMITTQKAAAASEEPGETKGTTTFNDLTPGYYLVYPEMGGTGTNSRNTDAMLINIPTNPSNTTWNIKSTYPTVEKQVNTGSGNADNGSAQVGDVVTFTLTSTVPDMSDFTTYVFQFTDKLPEGLTLVNKNDDTAITQNTDFTVEDITLTINDNAVNAANVTVDLDDGSGADVGKKILTVKINNLKAENLLESESFSEGDKIVLTYKAMINEKAVTTDSVTNEASVQYSNDPNGDGLGTSTPDESTVYTYEINVHKYTGTWSDSGTAFLEGAVFALSTNDSLDELTAENLSSNYSSLIPLKDNSGSTGGTSYVVDPDPSETLKDNTYTFTTNATGAIKIQGLEVGTYYLYEVTAPASYNKLKEPITITIAPTVTGQDPEQTTDYSKPLYTVTGGQQGTENNTVAVKNNSGITLPETGGIGTIGLTVAGVAVVLAGVMLPRKKKNKEQE